MSIPRRCLKLWVHGTLGAQGQVPRTAWLSLLITWTKHSFPLPRTWAHTACLSPLTWFTSTMSQVY